AAREPAEEQLIQSGDPRAQRAAARVLAAQQRLVRLQPAGAQEVFERVLEGGSHFAFLSPSWLAQLGCVKRVRVLAVVATFRGPPVLKGGRWCESREERTPSAAPLFGQSPFNAPALPGRTRARASRPTGRARTSPACAPRDSGSSSRPRSAWARPLRAAAGSARTPPSS